MRDIKAITNWAGGTGPTDPLRRLIRGFFILLVLASASPGTGPAAEAPSSSLSPKFAGLAEEQLRQARKNYEADPKNVARAWQLGKAYFFAGEFATDQAARARLAEQGIAVCHRALAAKPDSAETGYYHALNQGQLARTKLFGALSLVRHIEGGLRKAARSKPKLDFAGPDRCLGLLYRDAPGWPISVGSHKKAKSHLLKTIALVPEYPENILVLLETWIKWKDYRQLKADLPAGAAVLEQARKNLTGREWEPYWDDWNRRWGAIRKRAAKMLPGR